MSVAIRAMAGCIVRCTYCSGEGTYELDTPSCDYHVQRRCEKCGSKGFVVQGLTREVVRAAFDQLGMPVPWKEDGEQ